MTPFVGMLEGSVNYLTLIVHGDGFGLGYGILSCQANSRWRRLPQELTGPYLWGVRSGLSHSETGEPTFHRQQIGRRSKAVHFPRSY